MTTISELLKENRITLKDVAAKSGVALSTLSAAARKPIESWSIRVLVAFAKGLNELPSDLLKTLRPEHYELAIDNEKQTIQGVKISDKTLFLQIRFVVESEHLEGWNPTPDDIKDLLYSAKHPDPQMVADYQRIFGARDE
jgi:transcriptional regulator with XRE-family HTH domain